MDADPVKAEVEFDLALARGLNYYTGTIFEVKSVEVRLEAFVEGEGTTTLPGSSDWMGFRV